MYPNTVRELNLIFKEERSQSDMLEKMDQDTEKALEYNNILMGAK